MSRTTDRGMQKRSALRVSDFADSADPGLPDATGLHDPAFDKDSCGVGFIADIKGRKSHKIVEDALTILLNLEHRGAVGADPRAGDGAGILVQIPHAFFARKAKENGFTLPAPGRYAVGYLFLPRDQEWRDEIRKTYEQVARRRQAERPPVPSDYFEIADVPQVSRRDLEFLLRPEGKAPYVAEVELVDGWGHPLDVRIDFDNLLGEPVMTVRSAGPNGKFEGPRYRIGVIRPDSGTDDIVWSDGRGITWPDLRELIRTD